MAQPKRGCFLQGCFSVAAVIAAVVALFVAFTVAQGRNPATEFSEVGRIGVVEYFQKTFDFDSIRGQETVAGVYCYLVPGQQDPGGAFISEQYWSYAFLNDGSFRTFLEGQEQFGGTWSQEGSELTVNVNAIPGLSEPYTWFGEVSPDGKTITTDGITMQFSESVCVSGK